MTEIFKTLWKTKLLHLVTGEQTVFSLIVATDKHKQLPAAVGRWDTCIMSSALQRWSPSDTSSRLCTTCFKEGTRWRHRPGCRRGCTVWKYSTEALNTMKWLLENTNPTHNRSTKSSSCQSFQRWVRHFRQMFDRSPLTWSVRPESREEQSQTTFSNSRPCWNTEHT